MHNMMKSVAGAFFLSVLSASAGATWGLRFEVSSDGATWSQSIDAHHGDVVKFRMSSYFTPGTKIGTISGIGNAIVFAQFCGQTKVDGMLSDDTFQNLAEDTESALWNLFQISGNLIGLGDITSVAGSLYSNKLMPFVANPELVTPIYHGEIKISDDPTQRTLVLQNSLFGGGTRPGLQFWCDANTQSWKRQAPVPEEGPHTDVNATIQVNPGPCDAIDVSGGIAVTSDGANATPLVLNSMVPGTYLLRWFKDGVALSDDSRISGSQTSTLTIFPSIALDSGSYTLRVRSNCSSVFTASGNVAVACSADLNADAIVEDSDFVIFAAAYSDLICPASPAACPADLNADGFVDDSDFVAFAAQYNALSCS